MESRVQHMRLYIQDTMTRRHGCGLLVHSWLMYIVTMGALRASSRNLGLFFFFFFSSRMSLALSDQSH